MKLIKSQISRSGITDSLLSFQVLQILYFLIRLFYSFISNWLLNNNTYTIINRQFANGSYNPCEATSQLISCKSTQLNFK